MRTVLVFVLSVMLLAGCGGAPLDPNGSEREDRDHLRVSLRETCPERTGGRAELTAVQHEGYGSTSGFIVVCEDLTVRALDRDGGSPSADELQDAEALRVALPQLCPTRRRGVDELSSVDHSGHGTTSGFVVVCGDGTVHAAGR